MIWKQKWNERHGKASDWDEGGKRLNHEKGIDDDNKKLDWQTDSRVNQRFSKVRERRSNHWNKNKYSNSSSAT